MKIHYAIFSAFPEELDYIKNYFSNAPKESIKIGQLSFTVVNYENTNILLASSGFGIAFAAALLSLVCAHFNPELVLFAGVAGGIKEDLKIGDVIIAEHAFEAEIQNVYQDILGTPFESCLQHPLKNKKIPAFYAASVDILDFAKTLTFPEIKISYGTAVTSNRFPAPKDLFTEIKAYNAISIDMETSAFYQVAWLLNVHALAIRGISNLLDQDGDDENLPDANIKDSAAAANKVLLSILQAHILKYHHEKIITRLSRLEIKSNSNPHNTTLKNT